MQPLITNQDLTPTAPLIAADLGCILTITILKMTGARIRPRDQHELDHTSVLLPDGREVFPFHKMFDVLTRKDAEPLAAFVSKVVGG